MTFAVVLGPIVLLATWFGALATLVLSIGGQAEADPDRWRLSMVRLEVPISALLIATLQVLLNLALPHFGDVTVVGTHAIFLLLAIVTPSPGLPRARLHRALPRARIHRGAC